jgi:hypothetical protein
LRMRAQTSGGMVYLDRDGSTAWFFDTLKSEHNDERETA